MQSDSAVVDCYRVVGSQLTQLCLVAVLDCCRVVEIWTAVGSIVPFRLVFSF